MNGTVSEQSTQKTVTPVTVLVLGIVAAALSSYGLPGIILGIIAQKKVKAYLAQNNGVSCTKVMVGSILSKSGIYAGIGYSIFWTYYLCIVALQYSFFAVYILMIFGNLFSFFR